MRALYTILQKLQLVNQQMFPKRLMNFQFVHQQSVNFLWKPDKLS